MFGSHDANQNQSNNAPANDGQGQVMSGVNDAVTDNGVVTPSSVTPATTDPTTAPNVTAASDANDFATNDPLASAAPAQDDSPDLSLPSPVNGNPSGDGTNDDLLAIKQQALQQLSPLVGHLEQTPEEKFRTTMMMLQATDDQSLVQVAYDAANAISDEKTRAQALLDVVNEINYFTQHQNNGQ